MLITLFFEYLDVLPMHMLKQEANARVVKQTFLGCASESK